MKIFSKGLIALLILSLFVTVLVGCGNSNVSSSTFDIKKVEGEWILDTVNGEDQSSNDSVYTISKKSMKVESFGGEIEFDIDIKPDGFDVLFSDFTMYFVSYNESNDTLFYTAMNDDESFEFILKRK